MEGNELKQKSFIAPMGWISGVFSVIGSIFLVIGIAFQAITLKGVTINGVYSESVSAVHDFRLLLLVIFGGIGLLLLVLCLGIWRHGRRKKRQNDWLKLQGAKVKAELVAVQPTSFVINHQRLYRLMCSAKLNGTVYLFKSQLLNRNPLPFLKSNQVNVYYHLEDMRQYFVDIDDSITPFIEL